MSGWENVAFEATQLIKPPPLEYKQFCLDKLIGMKEKKEDERDDYEN